MRADSAFVRVGFRHFGISKKKLMFLMDSTDNFYTIFHFKFYMFIMYTTKQRKNSMPRYRTGKKHNRSSTVVSTEVFSVCD